MRELRALLTKTKAELKEERGKVIELEDNTRSENLRFHNIPESEEGVNHSAKKLFSAFCKRSCKWTLHKFDFTQCIELVSKKTNKQTNKQTNSDRLLLPSFAEKTETRFFPGIRGLKRAQGSRTLT